jgi:nucleotide-binding universal stress UspA family protein
MLHWLSVWHHYALSVIKGTSMKILIAYDGSDCSTAALDDLLGAGLPEKAQVIVFSVFEHWMPPPSREIIKNIDIRDYLALARRAASYLHSFNPGWETDAEIGVGSPATVIIEKADAWKPDLIVVGSHGRSTVGRLYFGSVSQKVLHEAHCSVRIARGRLEKVDTPVRIIIGVDGSSEAEIALRAAAARNWPKGSEAHIVTAMQMLPPIVTDHMIGPVFEWALKETARIEAMVDWSANTLRTGGLKTEVVVKDEDPKRLLIKQAEGWGANCIFVGSRGMGKFERFRIGSVSSAVAARAHCSVEVIRVSKGA